MNENGKIASTNNMAADKTCTRHTQGWLRSGFLAMSSCVLLRVILVSTLAAPVTPLGSKSSDVARQTCARGSKRVNNLVDAGPVVPVCLELEGLVLHFTVL